jgi:MarR family transcriptional regulator, organic hydroperoxide resistance regulator
MSNAVESSDWQLLARVTLMFRSLSDAFMDQIGMHRAQAGLLCTLFKQDGMTQTELAEQLSVQGATITNMLQRMEESGLVIRRRDAEDNRLVRVYLTDEGRQKERSINQQFENLEGKVFAGMCYEHRVQLRQMLRQMLDNMSGE